MAEAAELKANRKTIDSLSGVLNKIAKADASDLTSRKELEDLNFAAILPQVEEAIYVSQQLMEFPKSMLWGGQADRLLAAVDPINSVFNQLEQFSLRENEPQNRRNNIRKEAESQLPENVGVLSTVLAELRVSTFMSVNELAPKELLGRIESVQSLIDSADVVSKNAKEFATAAMAGRFGDLFEKLAKNYRWAAWIWFAVAILAAGGVIAFAMSIVVTDFGIKPGVSVLDTTVLPKLVGKLVGISVLTSLWVWFARQHRVNRHLFVVNKHRQTAL